MNQEERLQINSETKEMLRKGTIQQVKSKPAEFLNNLFLVNNKVGAHRPVINLKFLNSHTLARFQNGRDDLIKALIRENYFLIKIDLKDPYFGIPLDKSFRKYIPFQWEGNSY